LEIQLQDGDRTSGEVLDQVTDLSKELNVWAARLCGWLSVLSQGPTSYVFELGSVTWPPDIDHELQSDAYADGRMYEPQEVSEWQWQHALAHAENGDLPPAGRTLLAKAVSSLFEENYRSAILDAATAVELTLSKGIENKIKSHGADVKLSELLLKNKTLGALIQLAREFGLVLPANVTPNLVEKRNKVMHQGYIPSQEDANAATEVSRKIIGTLDLFPVHCDEEANYLGVADIFNEE
jgi:hypothetical protein